MTRIIAIFTIIFVVGDIGLGSALCFKNREAARQAVLVEQKMKVDARKKADQIRREAEAIRTQKEDAEREVAHANDLQATGRADASAEWRAPDTDNRRITCGVTPTDRYYIVENEIGRTRYSEFGGIADSRFQRRWLSLACDQTAPIHQSAILRRKKALQRQREGDFAGMLANLNSPIVRAQTHREGVRECIESSSYGTTSLEIMEDVRQGCEVSVP